MVWYNPLYIDCVNAGIEQMRKLFSYMPKTGGGGSDVCSNPSLACRIDTYVNARSDMGIPACAKPQPHRFELLSAVAVTSATVGVQFNDALEMTTGNTEENYTIIGSAPVEVVSAQVDPKEQNFVTLVVSALDPSSRYLLVVKNVISQSQLPLDPKHDSAEIKPPLPRPAVATNGAKKAASGKR